MYPTDATIEEIFRSKFMDYSCCNYICSYCWSFGMVASKKLPKPDHNWQIKPEVNKN